MAYVKLTITTCLILIGGILFCQDTTITERKIKKVKLYFAFDASRSFLAEPNVKFNGLKLGLELKEKYRFGLAFYTLAQQVRFQGKVDHSLYPEATDTLFFNFGYLSLFYDHVWLRTKRWELTSPLHLGSVNIELSYRDIYSKNHLFLSRSSAMIGFGGTAKFKIFRWFALGVGAGYRQMLTRDYNIGRSLNAPFYQFQVKLLIGELYRMAFKRKELEEW